MGRAQGLALQEYELLRRGVCSEHGRQDKGSGDRRRGGGARKALSRYCNGDESGLIESVHPDVNLAKSALVGACMHGCIPERVEPVESAGFPTNLKTTRRTGKYRRKEEEEEEEDEKEECEAIRVGGET